MKRYAIVPAWCMLVAVLAGCTKDPVSKLSEADTRIYITNHDSTTNFAAFKTFSISDSVAIISNGKLREKTRDAYDSTMIEAIATALTQRGYTRVSKTQQPDMGINVNNIVNTYTGYIDYGNYYDGYYGYWDPYYWGYPGYGYYGSYIGTYQVNEGVVSIDLFDLKDAGGTGKIKSVWNGVIRGEGIYNIPAIAPGIQALFDQSPYLKSNQ